MGNNQWSTTAWATHLNGERWGCYGVVKVGGDDAISISVIRSDSLDHIDSIPRPVARLLARRILQALEDTGRG